MAFTSHIHTTLPPLLALSLYVSSTNYTTTTRPALSAPLPFPLAYSIPPTLRATAKARSQHLNLSSLDLATASGAEPQQGLGAGVIPLHLRSAMQKSVTETIGEERVGLRFRLDGLVDQACKPLERLVGGKKWFLSDNEAASSLDAVALGYLSLALMPRLPQPWLREGLQERYPGLCGFVERGVRDIFGGDVTPAMALESRGEGKLPWERAKPRPLAERIVGAVVGQVVDGTPFAASKIKTGPREEGTVDEDAHSLATTLMVPVAVGAAAVAAVAGAVMVYAGLSADSASRSLGQMGEAGRMFEGLDFGGGGANSSAREGKGGVEVEAVGVEM